jgi:hypothetical protein
MIATAMEIQHATGKSIINPLVLEAARDMAIELAEGDYSKLEKISNLMYAYSATLASVVATNVSYACLGENTMNEIADELREFDILTQQIESENN